MTQYGLIKSLALAILGGLVGQSVGHAKHRASQPPTRSGRTPRFHWNYSRFANRNPDVQVDRMRNAATIRARKNAARLRWRDAGGASTIAERTAAGVAGN